jgi:N6-L-threonylcarbamoyladenine synthase
VFLAGRVMRILGIETSCDETAAAVVEETGDPSRPWAIRSNVIASQIPIHREWGGVVPELASRQHIRDICGVVARALDEAGTTWTDLGAVAVTQGPGLVGSLLVGVSFAKAGAAASGLPLVAVHHLAGHIESLVLQNGELPLPSVILVVSGGHTSLYLVEHPGRYQLLSRTRDDAAGEAYDKVAKLLGLGYPGGPVIDRLARVGNDRAVALPTTRLTHADRNAPALKGDLDFSFSGLKTAVLRHVQKAQNKGSGVFSGDPARPGSSGGGAGQKESTGVAARNGPDEKDSRPLFSESEIADICASFQRVVVNTLIDRTFDAARRHQARSIGIAGGVSANSRLRAELTRHGDLREIPTFLPSLALSTDNAAMIAAAGLRKLRSGVTADLDLNADAALAL